MKLDQLQTCWKILLFIDTELHRDKQGKYCTMKVGVSFLGMKTNRDHDQQKVFPTRDHRLTFVMIVTRH